MIRLRRLPVLLALTAVALSLALGAAPLPAHAQAPDAPTLLKSGQFVNAVETGSGTATLYRLADGSHLLRLEDFRVDNGPDLHLQLLATDGTANEVANLKGNRGNQNYALPAEFDPALYSGVRIHCRAFNIVMIVAPLS